MRGRLISSIVIASAVLGGALASGVSAAAPGQPRSTYIVVFKNGSSAQAEAGKLRGQGYEVRYVYENVFQGLAVDLPEAAARGLSKNPNVQNVELDGVVTASNTVTQTSVTWGLDRSDQRALPLDSTFTYPLSAGAGVTAYIIDTGINSSHVEFTGRIATGKDFIGDGNGTEDCNGHGTHVAGTVAGTTYGVAKAANVAPVRVLSCSGSGSMSGVIAGVDWVAANATKPAVANMSLGGAAYSLLDTAVANLHNSGVTVVVAAGNNGNDPSKSPDACSYSPSRAPLAITVGATTSSDAKASFSNFGTCLDIFAPGSLITSSYYTSNTATAVLSGTSMASPHVAGAAALVLGRFPTLTPAEVAQRLISASTPNVVTSAGTGSPNKLLYVEQPTTITDVAITTSTLPTATLNSAYSATLQASGGDGLTYTWSAAGLPSSLRVEGANIVGTPIQSGSFAVNLTVTSAGRTTSKSLQLTVVIPVLSITTASLPAGKRKTNYSATVSASGGTGVYSWSALGLPPGLSVAASTGTISGTPTTAGIYPVTVKVTSGAQTASRTLSLTIR